MARCTSTEPAVGNSRASSFRLCRSLRRCRASVSSARTWALRSGHARDAARDDAKLVDVGDRVVAEIDLRELDFGVVTARQRPQNAGASRGVAQAGEGGRIVHLVGLLRRRLQAMARLVQRIAVIQRADQVDVGRADGPALDQVPDHAHELGGLVGRRQPAQRDGEPDHAGPDAGEGRRPRQSAGTVRARRDRGRSPRAPAAKAAVCRSLSGQGGKQPFDAVQEHADFGHVPMQETVDEGELRRRRQAVVDELAGLLPERARPDRTSTRPPATTIELAAKWPRSFGFTRPLPSSADGRRIEIAVEKRRGRGPERGERGKAVDDGHVRENAAHVVAAAFAVALVERARAGAALPPASARNGPGCARLPVTCW